MKHYKNDLGKEPRTESTEEREDRERRLAELYQKLKEAKEEIEGLEEGQRYYDLYQDIDWYREEIAMIEGEALEKQREELRKMRLKMLNANKDKSEQEESENYKEKKEKPEIRAKKVEPRPIPEGVEVEYIEYEATEEVEIRYMKARPNGAPCEKKDKYTYEDKRTGEIKNYKLNETKTKGGIMRAIRRLRKFIKRYFGGGKNQLWTTLTYRGKQTDREKAKKDRDAWLRKIRRKNKNIKCISIPALQDNGNVHIHNFMQDVTGKKLVIPNEEMEKIWGKGYTNTERIKKENIDHLINYALKPEGQDQLESGANLYWKDQYFKEPVTRRGKKEEVQQELIDKGYDLKEIKHKTTEVRNESPNVQKKEINEITKIRYKKVKNKEDKQ